MSANSASPAQCHRVGKFLLCLVVYGVCVKQCVGEYFSSVDSLQVLGDIEMGLVKAFRQYIEMQEQQFASYRKFIEHVKYQHSLADEDVEDYVGNPINAFTLIKRMVTDWNNLHDVVKRNELRNAFGQAFTQLGQRVKVPDDNELHGAVRGLVRLQRIYNLKASELAHGIINDIDYGSQLDWQDCFEIATHLFDNKDLSLAISWFKETLKRLKDEKDNALKQKFQIDSLEYMALSYYELGAVDKAIKCLDEILKIDPEHNAKDTKAYMTSNAPRKSTFTEINVQNPIFANYTRLCKGVQLPERIHHQLKCNLETKSDSALILAPLKREELSREPEVTLYHDVLTDAQINTLLKAAEGKMERSMVLNGTVGMVIEQRISQQSWLDSNIPIVSSVHRLLEKVTGLDMKSAEEIQVVNYGIGGHYEPHHDYLGLDYVSKNQWGDRIATNMFYLSNVEQGGYTVFPKLNIYSRPEKGSLITWYNLHRSLDEDYRTLHAGCPVAKGSKTVANVWVHAALQEFRRPCELKRDEYRSQPYRD